MLALCLQTKMRQSMVLTKEPRLWDQARRSQLRKRPKTNRTIWLIKTCRTPHSKSISGRGKPSWTRHEKRSRCTKNNSRFNNNRPINNKGKTKKIMKTVLAMSTKRRWLYSRASKRSLQIEPWVETRLLFQPKPVNLIILRQTQANKHPKKWVLKHLNQRLKSRVQGLAPLHRTPKRYRIRDRKFPRKRRFKFQVEPKNSSKENFTSYLGESQQEWQILQSLISTMNTTMTGTTPILDL